MKQNKARYFLRLLIIGFFVFLVIIALGLIYFKSINNLNLYDLGVFVLFSGLVIALLSSLVFFSASSWRIRLQNYLPLEARGQGVRDFPIDILMTILVSGICLTFCGFMFERVSLSQGYRTPKMGTSPSVSLLRGELEIYMTKALEWQEDAFLTQADILIGDNLPWLIQVKFRSFEKPSEYLKITTDKNGEIIWKIYSDDPPFHHFEPIDDDDWALDTQEAVDIFVQDPEIQFCLNAFIDDGWTRISLMRRNNLLEEPVVWQLGLPYNCPGVERYYFIDATTGELFFPEK